MRSGISHPRRSVGSFRAPAYDQPFPCSYDGWHVRWSDMCDIVGRQCSGNLTDGVRGVVDHVGVNVAHLIDVTWRPDKV